MRASVKRNSTYYLRQFVNERRRTLDDLIFSASPSLALSSEELQWRSPLSSESHREYWDRSALRALGFSDHSAALDLFWPSGGPHWDALATVAFRDGRRGALLCEAKAHLGETPHPDACKAPDPKSRTRIQGSLSAARQFFRIHEDTPSWESPHYQLCNRLAFLYFFNEVLRIPTWLVWFFVCVSARPERGTSGLFRARCLMATGTSLLVDPVRHRSLSLM